jgi:hypothetical protein
MSEAGSLPCENHSSAGHMALTRSQLVNVLISLDAELLRLETNGESAEAFQLVFERMVDTSRGTVASPDRLWWWGQLYSAMDQQDARVKRFARLSCDYES